MKFFLIPGGLVTGGQRRNRFGGQSFDRVFRFSLCADLQHRHAGAGLSGQGSSGRELPRVERIVHDIDPECFMIVSMISEVKGRGFSLNKNISRTIKGLPAL